MQLKLSSTIVNDIKEIGEKIKTDLTEIVKNHETRLNEALESLNRKFDARIVELIKSPGYVELIPDAEPPAATLQTSVMPGAD